MLTAWPHHFETLLDRSARASSWAIIRKGQSFLINGLFPVSTSFYYLWRDENSDEKFDFGLRIRNFGSFSSPMCHPSKFLHHWLREGHFSEGWRSFQVGTSLGTRPSKNRKEGLSLVPRPFPPPAIKNWRRERPGNGLGTRLEGLVNRAGWKCTLRNVRNFINCITFRSQ